MWSVGCIIAELFTGHPIFPALDENELMEFHVLMCGNPPQHMISESSKKQKFFNINQGYKIIRSTSSRLVSLGKNQATLYHSLFKNRLPLKKTSLQEIKDSLSTNE